MIMMATVLGVMDRVQATLSEDVAWLLSRMEHTWWSARGKDERKVDLMDGDGRMDADGVSDFENSLTVEIH